MPTTSPMLRRPAPQDSGTPWSDTLHGAPAVWRGELAAAHRDATFLNRPDIHSDKALHAAVFTHRYAVGSGMDGLAAACNPVHILLDQGLMFSAHEVTRPGRCQRRACQALFTASDRHHSDLEHIRSYYRLESRIGVRVELGLRVRHAGRPGVIVDTDGQYLVLRLDDDTEPVTAHATSSMEYQNEGGWVPAVPRPTPERP